MNRIDKKFKNLKAARSKAFIAYITAGDPSMSRTEKLVYALEDAGVDIIELGIPFSDPVADGPTIQAASQRALEKGTNLSKVFSMVKRLRKRTDVPLVFMTYYNPVLQYGIKRFFGLCGLYGVDGVIVPDLPPEEASELIKNARHNNVATIFLTAPTSTKDRIKNITDKSRGFVYHVSLTGVTGARRELSPEVVNKVKLVKSITKKPVAVGFGISDPYQASRVAKFADGVIVGSAIIKVIEESGGSVASVYALAKKLAEAIHG